MHVLRNALILSTANLEMKNNHRSHNRLSNFAQNEFKIVSPLASNGRNPFICAVIHNDYHKNKREKLHRIFRTLFRARDAFFHPSLRSRVRLDEKVNYLARPSGATTDK